MSNEPHKPRSKTTKGSFTLSPNDAYNELDAPRLKRHELAEYEAKLALEETEARGGWQNASLGFFSRFWRG